MIKTYNIIAEEAGDRRIVSTFVIEKSNESNICTDEMIEQELEEIAKEKFVDFIDSLSYEEE